MLSTLSWLLLSPGIGGEVRVVHIQAAQDNTLIEDPAGALSNGSGPVFFAGRNNQPTNSIRRGVLRFELEGAVPEGVVIENVRLILHASSINGRHEFRLHRLLQDWGEGASSSTGGQGAPAAPGDATWLHTFYDQEFWERSGAAERFSRASALATVKQTGFAVWDSPGLVQDVLVWLQDAETNFGWVLLGNESSSQTAARFDTRENPDTDVRPVLEISYRTARRGP